jgi:regulator of replication initiation timing
MDSKTIKSEFKELCLNIGTIFNDIGVLFASLTSLILDNTVMYVKNKDEF